MPRIIVRVGEEVIRPLSIRWTVSSSRTASRGVRADVDTGLDRHAEGAGGDRVRHDQQTVLVRRGDDRAHALLVHARRWRGLGDDLDVVRAVGDTALYERARLLRARDDAAGRERGHLGVVAAGADRRAMAVTARDVIDAAASSLTVIRSPVWPTAAPGAGSLRAARRPPDRAGPQFLSRLPAQLPQALQSVALPPGAVQGPHVGPAQPLARRVQCHQRPPFGRKDPGASRGTVRRRAEWPSPARPRPPAPTDRGGASVAPPRHSATCALSLKGSLKKSRSVLLAAPAVAGQGLESALPFRSHGGVPPTRRPRPSPAAGSIRGGGEPHPATRSCARPRTRTRTAAHPPPPSGRRSS